MLVHCVVPLLLVPLLIVLALVALVPIALVQRYRMGTARQRARGWLATINVAGIALSAAILLASAALASVWVPGALKYTAGGLAGGGVARHGRTLAHALGARTWQASLHAESVARAGHYSARDRPNPVRLLACVAHVGCDCRRPRLVCDDRSGGLDGRGRGCAWVLPGVLDWCPQPDQAAFGTADAMITAEQAVRRAGRSVNDLVFELIDHVEVRNVEIPYRAERRFKRLVSVLPFAGAEMATDLPQRPQHPRPVETLPFTMLTVVHDPLSISYSAPRSLAGRKRRGICRFRCALEAGQNRNSLTRRDLM